MWVANDLKGQRFGRLIVMDRVENNKFGKSQWLCRCDCGKNVIVNAGGLKSGNTKSCGCLKRDGASHRFKKTNRYEIKENMAIIYTSNGKSFVIDAEDLQMVLSISWNIGKTGYVSGHLPNGGRKNVKLHRFIMGVTDRQICVDHINHDKSDNRKSNLRVCTYSQNNMNRYTGSSNSSGSTGVCWDNQHQRWRAFIGVNDRNICLGFYKSFDEAKAARKRGEDKYFGEYSFDNSTSMKKSGMAKVDICGD